MAAAATSLLGPTRRRHVTTSQRRARKDGTRRRSSAGAVGSGRAAGGRNTDDRDSITNCPASDARARPVPETANRTPTDETRGDRSTRTRRQNGRRECLHGYGRGGRFERTTDLCGRRDDTESENRTGTRGAAARGPRSARVYVRRRRRVTNAAVSLTPRLTPTRARSFALSLCLSLSATRSSPRRTSNNSFLTPTGDDATAVARDRRDRCTGFGGGGGGGGDGQV